MDYTQIRYETRDEVAWITLDRPDRLNAWTPRMSEEQVHAIEHANADPGVGAIVMTGEGRGFCAGADMEATFQKRLDGEDPGSDTASGSGGLPAGVDWVDLVRRSKPLVAAVNGAAVGVGLTTILPFDVIVASERAKFGELFVKRGLNCDVPGLGRLAAIAGREVAAELLFTGRVIDAAE
ncbi:MAG: enoyl-CoA hydratase/isomerase family protein, partial [Myxococcota bacterium]|nr:enoyl-CoA hydratase/isomerase family protein [Myxococcota bacterium]